MPRSTTSADWASTAVIWACCHDAAVETGNGAVGTWTTEIPALAGAPIDHVMASTAWTPTGSLVLRSMDGSGSDHRPLIVQLEPAGTQ